MSVALQSHQPCCGKGNSVIGGVLLALLWGAWSLGLFVAPVDHYQGEAYRIMYLHVPSAISAFSASFLLGGLSIWFFIKKNPRAVIFQRAAAEVGLAVTVLTLMSGAIWGRPIWGVWWTWDPRITTTLLLAILCAAWLICFHAFESEALRDRSCSLLSIMIAVDVPIIYKSVTWWRTLHQPPSIIREGGSTMDPDMRRILFTCMFAMIAFCFWCWRTRAQNLFLARELDEELEKAMQNVTRENTHG